MSTAAAIILFAAVTMYAIFGGADFGAGFWDLTAGGAKRGKRPREVIDHSIGPVWEANHVWLIFIFVVLWTCFPEAYASITLTMFVPLTLAALGIVLRGASFAFRKAVFRTRLKRHFGAIFAVSSVLVPYCFGAIAGGIASGRVPAGGEAGDPVTSWINPTSIVAGLLAVSVTAYVSAVLLTWDAGRLSDETMVAYFRIRAVAAGVAAGVVALVGLFVVRSDAKYIFDGLTSRALPLVVVSVLAGLGALVLLRGRPHRGGPRRSGRCCGSARPRVGSCPVGLPPSRIADGIAGGSAARNDHGSARRDRSRRALDRARLRLAVHARPERPAPGGGRRRRARAGGQGQKVSLNSGGSARQGRAGPPPKLGDHPKTLPMVCRMSV